MLRFLRVRNFALIDQLELHFNSGFNLLSGETGAGKSLVVDALGLLAGAKASADMVRSGESRAVVEAVFEVDVREQLDHLGLDSDLGLDPGDAEHSESKIHEVIVRREIGADGPNRVFINNQPCTAAALKVLAPALLDIHGQHEQQTLLDTSHQLSLIDAFADAATLASEVRALDADLRNRESELFALVEDQKRMVERLDLLRFQRDELERVSPQPNEAEAAREQLEVLLHASKLLESATRGYELLYESDTSAASALSQTQRALRDAAQHDKRLEPLIEQAETARILIQEIAYGLRNYAANTEADPLQSERLQARLADLERLQRKYGSDLPGHLDKVRHEMDSIGLAESQKEELERSIRTLRKNYDVIARALSAKRRAVSRKLETRVERELKSLAMPHARFRIEWQDVSPGGAEGIDRAELLMSANPGDPPRLLEKIASGGELSRVMLALRTILSGERPQKTLVFDEIDAGIGGKAAETVGEKLQELSSRYQVICVTHLAQIAAFADHQYSIEKLVLDGRTVTRVDRLSGEARVEELARMMSGSRVTDSARQHIKELLGSRRR